MLLETVHCHFYNSFRFSFIFFHKIMCRQTSLFVGLLFEVLTIFRRWTVLKIRYLLLFHRVIWDDKKRRKNKSEVSCYPRFFLFTEFTEFMIEWGGSPAYEIRTRYHANLESTTTSSSLFLNTLKSSSRHLVFCFAQWKCKPKKLFLDALTTTEDALLCENAGRI